MAQKITYIRQVTQTRVRWAVSESMAIYIEALKMAYRDEGGHAWKRVNSAAVGLPNGTKYLNAAQERMLPAERWKVLNTEALGRQAWNQLWKDIGDDTCGHLATYVLIDVLYAEGNQKKIA